jgi:aflatoxin B1 aldehyde reductase
VVIYNPLAGGFFAGKYKPSEVPASGRFSDSANNGRNYRSRYFKDAYFDAISLLQPVADQHGLTLLEIALRWCVHHSALKITKESGGNDGIIIGVSSLGQLESNLRDLKKGPLPQEVLEKVDEAWMVCKADCPPYLRPPVEYKYDTLEALGLKGK